MRKSGENLRRIITCLTTVIILLSLTSALLKAASAQEPTLSIIDPVNGSNNITFPEGTALNTNFTVNITLTNTPLLAAWQINVTYNPTYLNVTSANDVALPADNVFGAYADVIPPTLTAGSVYLMVGIRLGAPFEYVNVTTGTLCQITFTIIKNDTGLPLSCNIHFVAPGEYPIRTKLVDPDANEITVTLVDANYTIVPEFNNALIMVPLLSTSAIVILLFQRKAWFRRRVH
jgi:hypothetical protein